MRRTFFLLLALVWIPAVASSQPPSLQSIWTIHSSYGLARPWHLAMDANGNVYVADAAEFRVFVFTSDGAAVTSWTCPALDPLDFSPRGIAVSSDGQVYVTTPSPNGPAPFWVTAYTAAGSYLGPVGTMGSDAGQLGRPMGIAADASNHLFVTDTENFRVNVIDASGAPIAQWGGWGSGPGEFHFPQAIAVSPSGNVYVTDDDNQRIQVFTTTGAFITQWGSYGNAPGQFAGPWGIALDASGNVYVADASNNRIQVFSSTGQFLMQWGTPGSGPGQFKNPLGVAVGMDGRVYVADTFNSRIQVFAPLVTPTVRSTWGRLKTLYR